LFEGVQRRLSRYRNGRNRQRVPGIRAPAGLDA
jgi:hypothetical protein